MLKDLLTVNIFRKNVLSDNGEPLVIEHIKDIDDTTDTMNLIQFIYNEKKFVVGNVYQSKISGTYFLFTMLSNINCKTESLCPKNEMIGAIGFYQFKNENEFLSVMGTTYNADHFFNLDLVKRFVPIHEIITINLEIIGNILISPYLFNKEINNEKNSFLNYFYENNNIRIALTPEDRTTFTHYVEPSYFLDKKKYDLYFHFFFTDKSEDYQNNERFPVYPNSICEFTDSISFYCYFDSTDGLIKIKVSPTTIIVSNGDHTEEELNILRKIENNYSNNSLNRTTYHQYKKGKEDIFYKKIIKFI